MMNERIKELAEQCRIKFTCHECGESPFDYEKFAELIVRECMLICGAIQGASELNNLPDFASGAAQCKAIIKRDFGVEE